MGLLDVIFDGTSKAEIKAEEASRIRESNKTYDDMIDASDDYYNAKISATKEWEEKQTQLQKEQTDHRSHTFLHQYKHNHCRSPASS